MIDAYKTYEEMKDNNVLLSYKGEMSFELVNTFLDLIEKRFDREESNPQIKKKMFNVLVECLQNLCHHVEISEDEVKELSDGRNAIIMVWSEEDSYMVTTGNYIANSSVPKLQAWIERINSLSRTELRDLYKEVLDNNQFSAKGGGGLGFIDIARKSGEKLAFSFKQTAPDYSFFSFRIQIPKGK